MDNNSASIYDLITKLCEKYINAYKDQITYPSNIDIKRVRSKCYEILLSKKLPQKSIVDDLENNTDPFCHLLAWQYQLMMQYRLPQHAENLRICSEKLQNLNVFNDTTTTNIILLLLELRRVPEGEDKIMETTLNKQYSEGLTFNKSSVFTYFDESRFQLPQEPTCSQTTVQNEIFRLRNKKVAFKTVGFGSASEFLNSRHKNKSVSDYHNRHKDEGYESPTKSRSGGKNIWEIASREPPNEHRTWETFGFPSPNKELPFLCESGRKPATWLQNLSMSFGNLITENYVGCRIIRNDVTHKQFIKDVKYLLVGMESKTFKYNDKGELSLVPGTCVQGLSPSAMESYCKDLILCGSCYRGLNTLCTPNPYTLKYVHNGYIFSELCESIKRYLSYYRVAALSISDASLLLAFHERTKQLRNQIMVLASVCKVGPFTECGQIPHGVALLNYLYQKVMSITNKDVLMVLYSILYPCCQVYFSRFLQQWILKGSVQDPYGEFFINVNPKYVISRGRTYWTRSYTLREDIVPDFVTDLRTDILLCGKAMNLLKLCVPNSPLCLYMMDKRPDIMSCCVMTEQLSCLEINNHYYYLEATALSGPRISLSQTITCSHEQDDLFLSLIAKKRAATLTRIELERRKEIEGQFDKKKTEMKMLQEQYAEARKQKQIKIAEELEEEIRIIEKDARMQHLHDKIIEEEASNLISYYNKLFEASESRRQFFERRIENLRKVNLEGGENLKKKKKAGVSDEVHKVFCTKSSRELIVATEKKISDRSLSTSVSSDTFISTYEELPENKSKEYVLADTNDSNSALNTNAEQNYTSLDLINANSLKTVGEKQENVDDENNRNLLIAAENSQEAQKNKAKVWALELGIVTEAAVVKKVRQSDDKCGLTDAQKNKLKAMSSEYGSWLTDAQKNQLLVISSETESKKEEKKQRSVDEQNNINPDLEPALQNFQQAQKNKAKVMAVELGNVVESVGKKDDTASHLTDTQKNKLKVMLSEFESKQAIVEEKHENIEENNANRNFEIAQENKAKVLALELGIGAKPVVKIKNKQNDDYSSLTDAQKNKLKVMSSEFGQDISGLTNFAIKKASGVLEINRNKMISSNECFFPQQTADNNKWHKNTCDNENFLNKNVDNIATIDNNTDQNFNIKDKWATKKQDGLSLDFTKIDNNNEKPDTSKFLKVEAKTDRKLYSQSTKSPKFELEKISPMSVDSTPLSNVTTPSTKLTVMFDRSDLENVQSSSATTTATVTASTAAINCESGFNFEVDRSESLLQLESRRSTYDLGSGIGSMMFTKSISVTDAASVSPNCLKLCLEQSISIPLLTQIKLATNELLKYFINDLQYLKHLNSLRNYFFLLDGEFGRNITEGLFDKLYDADFPIQLINCHTLQALVYKALDYSTKFQENSSCLSFRINSLPKVFNLGDPDVFDCISLTYKAAWPLNILLPSDTVAKYDEVFKFLLKLHRVSWVLRNVFQDLKLLVKETESSRIMLLMMSPQYRRLHQCRHVMTHFIQTLQSYVVGEVLQSSWQIFEKNLELVTNFDQLYSLHTIYIKNILFMCLLNQKSAPLRKVLQKIFIVILKFYDYLRSRSWIVEDNIYTHPNFKKLENIFNNFEDLTQYLFRVGHKVVKSGYQPHLMQLLDMLDINNYYSKRSVNDVSLSASSH